MGCTCKLVGSLGVGYRGIQSIDISHHKGVTPLQSGEFGVRPVITTINITAYPRSPGEVFRPTTCPVTLNASFNWITVYDCDLDKYFYIYSNLSNINYVGDLPEFISVFGSVNVGTSLKASAASGPYSPYLENDGYVASNMLYSGSPIQFDTRPQEGFSGLIKVAGYDVVLKSFSYSRNTSMEQVTYTFEGGENSGVMLPSKGADDSC